MVAIAIYCEGRDWKSSFGNPVGNSFDGTGFTSWSKPLLYVILMLS